MTGTDLCVNKPHWLHSLKVAQLLRSADYLHTNQSRSYLNHLVCSMEERSEHMFEG